MVEANSYLVQIMELLIIEDVVVVIGRLEAYVKIIITVSIHVKLDITHYFTNFGMDIFVIGIIRVIHFYHIDTMLVVVSTIMDIIDVHDKVINGPIIT